MNSLFAVTDACAGCGACIKTCPEKAIQPAPRDHDSPLIVLADRCSGCAECAEVCPVSACVEVAPLRYAPGNRESGIGNRTSSAVPDATTGDLFDAKGRVPEENSRSSRRSRRKAFTTFDSRFPILGEARKRRPQRSDDL